MNIWTKTSIEFAQQKNYLDELYKVYPITPNLRRKISESKIKSIKQAFLKKDNEKLVRNLLSLDLFPLKDSYVAFLKNDNGAIKRNPQTINRLAGNLYQIGIDEVIEKSTEPKETNRQLGPMFKHWIDKGTLGVPVIRSQEEFKNYNGNCVFNSTDIEMKKFAQKYLGFNREKGVDFIAKFNNKYIIAETKFLTDYGGHQNAQFEDAIRTLDNSYENKIVENEVIPIAIMDGVLYIKGRSKMYKYLQDNPDKIVLSALVLREFLYSI